MDALNIAVSRGFLQLFVSLNCFFDIHPDAEMISQPIAFMPEWL
jgi:hypothetical protein